jgi:DMSO/TMAO reductase YedYZ molybdopterin-dependent catalytic subunit
MPGGGDARPYGRRAFLALVAGGVSALWWGGPVWSAISGGVERLLTGVGAPVSGGWRIYAVAYPYPDFDPATWRLRVDGLVERPLELSYDDLRALPQSEHVADFHCVTGWSVEGVRWTGVSFADLLAAARPRPEATWLELGSGEEPYADGIELETASLPGVMVAYELDGAPLSRPHGAPARAVIPQMYGYKGVKWLNRVTLVDREVIGFWEHRGYDRDAWVGRSNGYGA